MGDDTVNEVQEKLDDLAGAWQRRGVPGWSCR